MDAPIWRIWRNSRRVGPRSRWTKVHEGAIPSVRTNLSRRGWNVDTADSKPAGRDCPCRCDSGRRDQSRGRAWNRRPGGLKNRCAAPARGRASRPGRTKNLSVSGGTYTRESQKLVGGSPCRCKSCLADQFQRPCPLASAGDPPLKRAMRVRFPSRRPGFCRVVQSRTVRLIHGIALDERQGRERYPARQPVPVRRSERRADPVSRTRPVRPRRRAPIFQVVRSGLLRLISAWLSVRIRSSPTSQGGSSKVEHVIHLVRFSPGFFFGQ